jgi:hypothetical protein
MGEIEIMTDDDAKDVAKAIEKIINRNKIHISVDKAKRICATIKMMEFVGYSLEPEEPEYYANPATVPMPSVAPNPSTPVFIAQALAAHKKRPRR